MTMRHDPRAILQGSINRLFDISDELYAGSITPTEADARTRAEDKLRRAIMKEINPRRRRS